MAQGQPASTIGIEIEGRHVTLMPLEPSVHALELHAASHGPAGESVWRHMRDGPFADVDALRAHLEGFCTTDSFIPFAILDSRSGDVGGMISLMRHDPAHRTIELGYAFVLPVLQRKSGATEAFYLALRLAMETMDCRRCEWRCDSENVASHRAALRLGFRLEGKLRQHLLVKGRNRDTLVLSLLDTEWPDRKAALEKWLRPENFDATGGQILPLRR